MSYTDEVVIAEGRLGEKTGGGRTGLGDLRNETTTELEGVEQVVA